MEKKNYSKRETLKRSIVLKKNNIIILVSFVLLVCVILFLTKDYKTEITLRLIGYIELVMSLVFIRLLINDIKRITKELNDF